MTDGDNSASKEAQAPAKTPSIVLHAATAAAERTFYFPNYCIIVMIRCDSWGCTHGMAGSRQAQVAEALPSSCGCCSRTNLRVSSNRTYFGDSATGIKYSNHIGCDVILPIPLHQHLPHFNSRPGKDNYGFFPHHVASRPLTGSAAHVEMATY